MNVMVEITDRELQLISQYIHTICGVKISRSKEYLIKTRLNHLISDFGCISYTELYNKAKSDITHNIDKKIIDAITTPETLFFRDMHPFDLLKNKILNDLIDKRSNMNPIKLRIWSAASSTGQEIYSIAIIIREICNLKKIKVELLATDISEATLNLAREGRYTQFEINRGLPKEKIEKYFTYDGNAWYINDKIKNMVNFQKRNLLEPFTDIGKIDIVFCRNVAIYFTLEDRSKLFNKIADIMQPDGYLIIGSSEFLTGVCFRFKAIRHLKSTYYQL
ncbi:chemotaxis protein methyltransferase CheR [Candidatus Magnetomoraceae bacterium gMMP-13]